MPNAFIRNQSFNTYGAVMSAQAEMLVAAGWTYKASGDGLSGYSATGKIFASTGTGALGWGNSRAWCRLADPAGRRELVIQHNNASLARIKISADAKFTGGSPSATVVPSATDERVIWGAGTDATPTFSIYFNSNLLLTGQVVCQGAAFAAPPYGFWFGSQQQHQQGKSSFLMMDPVLGSADDPDPVVWQVATSEACLVTTTGLGRDGSAAATWTTAPGGTTQGCFAHLGGSFVYVQPASYAHGTLGANPAGFAPGGAGNDYLGTNPYDRNQDVLPVLYTRLRLSGSIVPWGVKGWSTLSMWTGKARTSLFDTLADKRWICFGHLWLRWDGLTQPIG